MTCPRSPVENGEIVHTISTPHFILIEVRYGAGTTVQLRGKETGLLMFAVSGHFVELDGEGRPGDDNTVLVIHANRELGLEFRRETRCVIVTAQSQTASLEVASLLGNDHRLRRYGLKLHLHNVWCAARRDDPAVRLALDGAIFTMLAELLRAHSRARPSSRLSRSLRFLHSAGAENVTMAELARISGMSVYAFERAFKSETGTSFAAYRRRLRVERAKVLLRKTHQPVREIGMAVGFSDQAHFSRVFARYAGMSPADYRRVHGNTAPC